jgi:hypothetical protein
MQKYQLSTALIGDYTKLDNPLTLSQLSRKYKISTQTISYNLRKQGIPTQQTFRSVKADKHKRWVISAYQNGMTTEKIAKRLGISLATLYLKLREWHVPQRCPTNRKETRVIESNKQNIISWYTDRENPLTAAQIGSKIGIAECTIQLRLKAWGIPARSYKKAFPEQVMRMYQNGLSISEIAQRLHCDQQVVRKALDIRIPQGRRLDNLETKRLRYLYSDRGMSVEDIADIMNEFIFKRKDMSNVEKQRKKLTATILRARIDELGFNKGEIKPEEIDVNELNTILSYVKEGLPLEQIAKRTFHSRSTINKVIERYRFIKINRAAKIEDEAALAAKIRELAEKGQSRNIISTATGLSLAVLYDFMRKHGIKASAKVREFSEEEIEQQVAQIRGLRKQIGMTLEKIAAQLNVSTAHVGRLIREYHIPASPRKYTPELIKAIRNLHSQGLSTKAISFEVNMPSKTVEYILLRQSLVPNPVDKGVAYTNTAMQLQNSYIAKYYPEPFLFSMKLISDKLNLDKTTIKARVKMLGMRVRTPQEAKAVRHLRTLGKLPRTFYVPKSDFEKMQEKRQILPLEARKLVWLKPAPSQA